MYFLSPSSRKGHLFFLIFDIAGLGGSVNLAKDIAKFVQKIDELQRTRERAQL
jgi:hypothetical protein